MASLEADVAVLFGEGQYQGYVAEKLLPEVVYPVCSPKLYAEFGGFPGLADLIKAPLLKLNADMGQKWMDWDLYSAQWLTMDTFRICHGI